MSITTRISPEDEARWQREQRTALDALDFTGEMHRGRTAKAKVIEAASWLGMDVQEWTDYVLVDVIHELTRRVTQGKEAP